MQAGVFLFFFLLDDTVSSSCTTSAHHVCATIALGSSRASSEPYHFLRCRRSRSRSLANPSCRAVCSAETRDGPRPTSLVQLLTPSSSVTVLFASTVTPPTTAEYHAARDPIAGALPPLPDSVAFSTIGEVVRGYHLPLWTAKKRRIDLKSKFLTEMTISVALSTVFLMYIGRYSSRIWRQTDSRPWPPPFRPKRR
ncbi:hypothetical protein KC367_g257 [Hortaea werneckii]|nr:hypothetical protein KC367_g257 [Hortaea werneckii]